jgi:sulfite reductase alpha subunit-like flavoprotein
MTALCQNEDTKTKLLFLFFVEGKADFDSQIQSRMKGLIDLVEEFNVHLSLEELTQIANPITPRLYTIIASSNEEHLNAVHLCVSIATNTLPAGKTKVGLNSDFLVRQYRQPFKVNL